MTLDLPSSLTLLYSPAQIRARVREMGQAILPWAAGALARGGQDVLGVPVLRGGLFFFADLVREIAASVDIDPVQSRAYKDNDAASPVVEIGLGGIQPEGRELLLIDDVCDSGRTLRVLTAKLRELGAREVRTAVLIKRIVAADSFAPDYVGFEYPGQEWFVGYGMDDRQRWRNLPYIAVKAAS